MVRTLVLDPTYACNYRCKTCLCPQIFERSRETLDVGRAEAVLRKFREQGGETLMIYGGEPLLVRQVPELLAMAKSLGLITHITTNGSLLDENRSEDLAARDVDVIEISIDGGRQGHEAARGPATFDRTLRGLANTVSALRRHPVATRLNVHCTVSRLNFSSFSHVIDAVFPFADSLSVSVGYLSVLREDSIARMETILKQAGDVPRSHWRLPGSLLVSQEDIPDLRSEVRRCIDLAARHGLILRIDPVLVNLDSELALITGRYTLRKTCTVFNDTRIVGPGGRIGACPMLTEFSFGSLDTLDPDEWFLPIRSLQDLETRVNEGYLPVCRGCCNHAELM